MDEFFMMNFADVGVDRFMDEGLKELIRKVWVSVEAKPACACDQGKVAC